MIYLWPDEAEALSKKLLVALHNSSELDDIWKRIRDARPHPDLEEATDNLVTMMIAAGEVPTEFIVIRKTDGWLVVGQTE